MTRFLPGRRRPLVIGHRGSPLAAPENSLASFEAALRAGADGVECDARLSADGAVVLHHDETLERTTDGAGEVRARSLAALRGLRLRGEPAGERIPLLADLLDLCRGRGGAMVEAKVDRPADAEPLVDAILAVLARFEPADSIAVISFSAEAVARARAKAPHLPRGITFESPFAPEAALREAPDIVTVERSLLDARFVAPVLAAGAEVFAYSLDLDGDRRFARAVGCTGWITNLPDRREILPDFRVGDRGPGTSSQV